MGPKVPVNTHKIRHLILTTGHYNMPKILSLLLFVAALAAPASAQSSEAVVWGSVALVMHGERTPRQDSMNNALTPQGARQMLLQGAHFRSRYLLRNESEQENQGQSSASVARNAPIQGIHQHAIDNSELSIRTSTDSFAMAGAVAFMQGLYPAIEDTFLTTNMSHVTESNDNMNYPLEGYQYPAINALSTAERQSI